jgi:hypothetical protein
MRKPLSFKALSHKASRLATVSEKAALGAAVVIGELPVIRPTVGVASLVTGASAASINKALKISSFERELMIGGSLTLGEVDEPLAPSDESISIESLLATAQATADDQMAINEKALIEPARPTVDGLREAYMKLLPSEKVAFGRSIGVERVWLPRQRRR